MQHFKARSDPCNNQKKMHYLFLLLATTFLLLHVSYGLDTIGQVYTANDTETYFNFPGYGNSTTKLSMYLEQATIRFQLQDLTQAQLDTVSSLPKPDPSLVMYGVQRVNILSAWLWNATQSLAYMQVESINLVGMYNVNPRKMVLYVLNDTTNAWSSTKSYASTEKVMSNYMDLQQFFNRSGFTFGVFGAAAQGTNGTFGSSIVLEGPGSIYYALRSELDQSLTVSVNIGAVSTLFSVSKSVYITMKIDSKLAPLYGFTNYYPKPTRWTFSYDPTKTFKDYKGNTVQIIPSSISCLWTSFSVSSVPIEMPRTQDGNQVTCLIPKEGDVAIVARLVNPPVDSSPAPAPVPSSVTNKYTKMVSGVRYVDYIMTNQVKYYYVTVPASQFLTLYYSSPSSIGDLYIGQDFVPTKRTYTYWELIFKGTDKKIIENKSTKTRTYYLMASSGYDSSYVYMKAYVGVNVEEDTSDVDTPSNLPVIIAVVSSVAGVLFIGLVLTLVMLLVVRYRKRQSVEFQRLNNDMQTSFVAVH